MAYTFSPLLVIDDFNDTSEKLDDNPKFDNSLRDAQENRLGSFLGKPLYLQLINNITDGSLYQDLWEGAIYENSLGEDVQFYGLKQYLIDITKHIYFKPLVQNSGDTFAFQKNENVEINIEEQRISAAQYLNTANNYREDAVNFLNKNIDIYTLWKGNCEGKWAGSIFRPK